jgi:hypothetical protein
MDATVQLPIEIWHIIFSHGALLDQILERDSREPYEDRRIPVSMHDVAKLCVSASWKTTNFSRLADWANTRRKYVFTNI